MTEGLLDPLRHNAWATMELLGFCAKLSPVQLEATATGTYGTILSTLQHSVGADARYLMRLDGRDPGWPRPAEEVTDVGELLGMAEGTAAGWEALMSRPFDPDRTIHDRDRETGEPWEAEAGVMVAQALNHGNEHRAQIYTILTTIGLEPPDLDGWSYGEATGRFRMPPRGTAS